MNTELQSRFNTAPQNVINMIISNLIDKKWIKIHNLETMTCYHTTEFQDRVLHSLQYVQVIKDHTQLVQQCCADYNRGYKPQFTFVHHMIAKWANPNNMTHLEMNTMFYAFPTEFKRELACAVLRFRERRDVVLLEQMDVSFVSECEIKKLFRIIQKACSALSENLQIQFPVKKLEGFVLGLIVLVKCKTYDQFIPAVLSCFSHLTDKTLTGLALDKFNLIVSQLWSVMEDPLEEQGYIRDFITNWERMADSKILDKFREFMSFCMTFGTLEHFGLSSKTAEIVYGEFKAQKKHKSVTSFALAFCDVLEFVFSRLCVCVETRSLGPLLHNADNYALWYDNCATVVEWNLMLGQDCLIRTFTDQEFQTKCEDCIKTGEEYVNFAKSIKERRELTALISKVRIIYGDFMTAEIVGRPRQAPFTLLLSGNSAIGKTSIQRMLVSVFAKITGLPDDPRYFYTRDPSDEFMSGFKSYMWFINMDDVATTSPKMLKGVDTGISELFRYVQNIACTANMADLSEKGKIAIRPEFIIATTNAPTLNAEAMFTCPSAARRRLPWRITPTVRHEYRIENNTDMLDTSKCNQRDGEFPDYWTFKVEEIRPKPLRNQEGAINLDAQEILIFEAADLKTLLTWFVSSVKEHRKRQSSMKERMEKMSEIKLCEHGLPTYMCCEPLEVQTDIVPIIATSIVTTSSYLLLLGLFFKRFLEANFWFNFFLSLINYRPRNTFNRLPLTSDEWHGISRNRIRTIGQNAADFLSKRKNVVIITVILACIASWRYAKSGDDDEVPTEEVTKVNVEKIVISKPTKLKEQVKFVKPIPVDEKTRVRWVTDIPVFNRCNLLPQAISSKARSRQDMLEQIARNVTNVVFSDGKNEWSCNLLFLGGFDVAMNTHDFEMLPDSCFAKFLFYDQYTHIGKNTNIVFNKGGFETRSYYDTTIIRLEEFPPMPSIKGLIPKGPLQGRFNGTYIYRNKEGLINHIEVKNIEVKFRSNPDRQGVLKQYHVAEGHVDENTFAGLCGSPMVIETPAGFSIIGIHSLGGKRNIACASLITQDVIFSNRKFDVGECNMGELEEQMEMNDNSFLQPPVILDPILRSRDPLAYRRTGLGEVYGSLSKGPSNPKTKVCDTFISEFWKSKGKSTNCIPPKFSTYCWHKGLDDMMSPEILISTSEANFVSQSIARDFIKSMTSEQMEMIEFYDYETAILGADGVNGVEKLDFKTSTGFPMKKSKKSIFIQQPNGKYSVPKEVIQACDKIHANADNGIRSQVIFSASLKDEPRDKEKVESNSIRIFMSAPMPYCIVMRQYFLSLVRVIQRNPLQFETAVGINAHSDQWDVLAHTLMEFSPLFIVGDHSKYDKRMAAMYIYNMFKVAIYIILFCMETTGKITSEEYDILEDKMLILAVDTAYAFVDFNGTLVSFLKNHVSGHILTVIINSFGNSGYIRMAYRRIVTDDQDLVKFQQRCKVVTYGDDFVVAVKPEIKHFNFITMKQAMSTFGVSITPAIKTDDDYEFLSITEIDFLKRRFAFHEDLQRWVGPLDKKSIEKSLLIAVRSDSITPEEQSIYSMMSAQQEMFFHGKKDFNEFSQQIQECIEFYNLHYLVKKGTFPTYETLLAKYKGNTIVHFDDFIEEDTDEVLFTTCDFVPIEVTLEEQCECQETMRLNSLRITMDSSFEEDCLERDFKLLFKNKISRKFRSFGMKCKCATPFGFSCDSFCWLCQQSPQTNFVADLNMRDCQSLVFENKIGFKQSNILTRVEQATSVTDATVTGSHQPCDDHYLMQCAEENEELHFQMDSTNLEFVDEAEGDSIDLSQFPDPTRTDDELNSANFESYLKRPVKIFSITWEEGDSLNETFQPWLLWAQQTQINKKLTNFGLFRGSLKLKLLINASPFFYGAGRLTYEPLIGYMRKDTIGYGGASSGYKIAKSQQKGFEFYPQNNQGGEMTLPFFYPKTWVDLTSSTDIGNMGRCSLFTYTNLSNANSVVTASVTVSVIAWCEDAVLSAPTYALAVQSEYSKLGPISGPSSAVAEAARALAKVPILRPFAMGTEMIASNVGSVAKYFGFTNVPTTTAQQSYKPGSHYGMATTEISTPYEKLSLDDKNELTIDPRVAGLPPKDEMVISEIIQRESYLTAATWAASTAAPTKLFSTYVTPTLYDYESSGSVTAHAYYQTPMCHLSRLFNSWRGSIIFRFRFICTPFHKGRVRITWDPRYDLSTIADVDSEQTITSSFTKIIDIGETQDVEMEIPYMQALAFMTNYGTSASTPQRLFSTTTLPVISSWNSYFNGTLSVTVLNKQTSPVTSSDITMLVFVKAGTDFTFANPAEAPSNFTFLHYQMEESVVSSPEEKEYLSFVERTRVGDLMKIHMGESIHSLRQLIHRQNFYNSFTGKSGTDVNSSGVYNKWVIPRYPQIDGYCSPGRNQFAYAQALTTTDIRPVSYSAPSVFSMIAPLYIGARGSIVYNVNVDSPSECKLTSLARSPNVDWVDHTATQQGWFNPAPWDIYTPSALGSQTKYRSLTYTNGASGRVLTNQLTQAGIMAHFPYYSPLRFTSSVGYLSSDDGGILPIPVEERNQGVEILVSTKNNNTTNQSNELSTIVDVYMMAGHDFSFLYFNCVPTFYYYGTKYGTAN